MAFLQWWFLLSVRDEIVPDASIESGKPKRDILQNGVFQFVDARAELSPLCADLSTVPGNISQMCLSLNLVRAYPAAQCDQGYQLHRSVVFHWFLRPAFMIEMTSA